jgi:Protein of unknown function (DUF3489)
MSDTKPLTANRQLVLNTAAQRSDGSVLPLPPDLNVRGAARKQLIAGLLSAGLLMEEHARSEQPVWRQDADGQPLALLLAPQSTAVTRAPIPTNSELAARAEGPGSEDGHVIRSVASANSPRGKLGLVLEAIATDTGSTIDELVALTGWLPHTTRAAITGLRKRGFPIQIEGHDGRKAYRLTPAA